MAVKTNADTDIVELVLNKKYLIKPLMTIEEIKNSNLVEIMDEKCKIDMEQNSSDPLCLKRIIDGEEISIRLDIVEEKLKGIYITVDEESESEDYSEDDEDVQIPQIEGINEAEYEKVQELYEIYGEFPSEDNLVGSIKTLQDRIKKVSDQINSLNQEKTDLEEVGNAFKALDEIYSKYESSGFDENVLNENMDNIARYEKTKERLKATDITDEIKLRKIIGKNRNKVAKLKKIKADLNMESTQISDSYSAYQKYKDIGTRKLNELKKEFICNLKSKDELKSISLYDSDKIIQHFCKKKLKSIDKNIEKLNKKINAISVVGDGTNDAEINYLVQKLGNDRRYIDENHPLNDSNKENEINKIVKSAMEDINSNMYDELNPISELYNIENRMIEIRKKLELKENLVKLEKEAKDLEEAKGKLGIIDKYEPIMTTRDKHKDNELFKNSYEKKYEKEIREYNGAQNALKVMKICNWNDYNKVKNIYKDKEKTLLKSKDILEVKKLDSTKELEKVAKYKNKRDEIIKKNSDLVDESFYFDDKDQKTEFVNHPVEEKENNANEIEETNEKLKEAEDKSKALKEAEDKSKALKETKNKNEILKETENIKVEEKEIKTTKNDAEKSGQVKNNHSAGGNSHKGKSKNKKKDLRQLKMELVCNLKIKQELNLLIENTSNKEIRDFSVEKIKDIDTTMKDLDKEIRPLGVLAKSEFDDSIRYMREKAIYLLKIYNTADRKKYLQGYNSFKENRVNEIFKDAMRELDPDIADEFMDIHELCNLEGKIAEIQKVTDLKKEILDVQDEGNRLEHAKQSLAIVSRYTHMMSFVNNALSGNVSANSMLSQTEEYDKAQKRLKEANISNKKEFKEARKAYEAKKKRILADDNVSKITNLDLKKEVEKLDNYKAKRDNIIKKYKTKM